MHDASPLRLDPSHPCRSVFDPCPGRVLLLAVVLALVATLVGCQFGPSTPTPATNFATPTPPHPHTSTPSPGPTPTPEAGAPFQTYAYGELLPDMRVPIQRSATGEGGWYVVIGTEEGWAQFLSQMGQPAQIWEPVRWEEEILIGALLGVRAGRGHAITIAGLELGGVEVQVEVTVTGPPPGANSSSATPWITCPFHMVRVPRVELPMGPVTFRFVDASGPELASQVLDTGELNLAWLPGPGAAYPTPTPALPTPTPGPTPTPTPVPNLRVRGIVLDVSLDPPIVRIMPASGNWRSVDLMQGTSIMFSDGQPASVAQLEPGMTVGVLGYPGEESTIWAVHIDILSLPPQEGMGFAAYQPRSVTLSTIYNGYSLPLSAADLDYSLVTVPLSKTFHLTQTRALTESGFVVVPGAYKSFAALYTDPQYITHPVFISADSALHVSQLLFDRVLRAVERGHLLPELTRLDQEMYARSWEQYEAAQALGTPAGERLAAAAQRNAAYFAVALSLLDPAFVPPEVISPVVRAELALISATQGITISPLFDIPDVPQEEKLRVDYAPLSGHAVQDERARRYAQAMAWHHLVAWRLGQREEARSVALIAHILNAHSAPRILWQRVYDVASFFYGQEALLTPADYGPLAAEVWGADPDLAALADDARLDEFIAAAQALPLPDNALWVWIWRAEGRAARDLSFLGHPFQVDPYILAQATGAYAGIPEGERRLPSGAHLAAVLGSPEAYVIASQLGDGTSIDQVRNELAALRDAHWTAELHWNWLYLYRPLLQAKSPSYPAWMRTTAWERKVLQTMLGSWTEVQHDADLPVDPAAAPVSSGGEASPLPPWGYVEPQPEVYARLAALNQAIVEGLEDRLMLDDAEREMLSRWQSWLSLLQDVARRELTGQTVTELEFQRLAEYGAVIEALTRAATEGAATEGAATEGRPDGVEYDAAVAVSVAKSVVDVRDVQQIEAVGRMDEIYVMVERGRRPYLVRGGIYSHYEFEWPAATEGAAPEGRPDEVLTDLLWQQMLDGGQAPPRPEWAVVQE